MSYRAQEIKVGIMVTVSFVLLVVLLVVVSGIQCQKNTVAYTTRLAYVGGLDVGSPVRLGGLQVGRVAEILPPGPGDRRITLRLEVDANAPVKQDSRAYLTSIGLMGEFYVEIRPGSPDAPRLPPGSEIPSLDATTFSQLSVTMGDLVDQLKTLMTSVNRLMDEENPDGISSTVAEVNALLRDNRAELASMLSSLKSVTVELQTTMREMNRAVREEQPLLHAGLQHLDSTLVATRSLVKQLGETTRQMSELVNRNASSTDDIVRNLERSTRNLEVLSRTLRDKPWLLVRKSTPKPREIPGQ